MLNPLQLNKLINKSKLSSEFLDNDKLSMLNLFCDSSFFRSDSLLTTYSLSDFLFFLDKPLKSKSSKSCFSRILFLIISSISDLGKQL